MMQLEQQSSRRHTNPNCGARTSLRDGIALRVFRGLKPHGYIRISLREKTVTPTHRRSMAALQLHVYGCE
jgi:hypothetical protein